MVFFVFFSIGFGTVAIAWYFLYFFYWFWNCCDSVVFFVFFLVTPLHRRESVRWCNRLRGWTFRNWQRIWFSDESCFLLQKRDGRIRVYRCRNECFSFSCVQEVDSFSRGSVMMWAAISNDKTDLVHVPGNLTAVRYRDEIIQPHIMLWYFKTVPTVWYFRTVPTVWYFKTVPTVWYFRTVPTVWYFKPFRQCGILKLFRQCGILKLFDSVVS